MRAVSIKKVFSYKFQFTYIVFCLSAMMFFVADANASVFTVPSSQFPCDMSQRPAPPAEDNCLQSAINAANPGDDIILQANQTFLGPFMLRSKRGESDEYIRIMTSALNEGFPSEGHRVNPTFAHLMPKILAPGSNEKALVTELIYDAGIAKPAHHYALIGIEITQAGAQYNTRLVKLGRYKDSDGMPEQTKIEDVAHHLIIDRCYVHKHPQGNLRNGVEIHSAYTNIINSYFTEIHDVNSESHLIAGWNGPGPFKINNNFLEGSSINILFGGASPTINEMVPSDIEFRHNIVRKPLEWYQGTPYRMVKNLFELKNARRVLVDRNIFENIWGDGQDGSAIVLTPKNDENDAPWTAVEDVMFSNNIVRRAWGGVRITRGNYAVEKPPKRISLINNLFTDIDPQLYCGVGCGGSSGKFIPVISNAEDTVINHNTILQSGNIVTAGDDPSNGFVFTNNLSPHNEYGIKGAGAGVGNGTLQAYFPNAEFNRNVIIKTVGDIDWTSYYPVNNEFPQNMSSTGFIDSTNAESDLRNYRLAPNSPYRNQATDGRDIGANIDAFNTALKSSDFDSDGKTDVTIWNPADGGWFISGSADDETPRNFNFGIEGDTPVPADYDGDGQTDYAVFRPATGDWQILRSSDSKLVSKNFGLAGDIPVPSDYDGDGKSDLAVWRPSNGIWYVFGSQTGWHQTKFGTSGDKPVIGDYDSDGKSDFAVWRPSNGTWHILKSFSGSYAAFQFGLDGDIPVQGDYDGDGNLDIAVWRPVSGVWYVWKSSSWSMFAYKFGTNGDKPIVGDFDGDGENDISVWRSSNATWFSMQSLENNYKVTRFGANGDMPASTIFVGQ